jgi:mannitol/fructose-specific phosphotransferase system IIA component (Ntr-type)/DNA-binding Xre family transcriptional regulator
VEVNFGYLLRTLRICAGLSLRELARSIDVSPTYLSLVENGKQPPPNPARITKIEEILKVPPGSLLSVVRGFDPNILAFVQATPEVIDFLNLARERNFPASGFMEMTAFLNVHGSEKFLHALRAAAMAPSQSESREKPSSRGLYVWRFLDENLIFDMTDKSEKSGFLQEAVKRLSCHCNGINPDAIVNELMRREKIASTGIGRGVAVPHAYVAGLDRMIVMLARTPQGVEFNSIDGEPVYMVLLLAGPRSSKNLHLLLLSRIAKLVRNKSFCQKVLSAPSPGEIISIFQEAETNIP